MLDNLQQVSYFFHFIDQVLLIGGWPQLNSQMTELYDMTTEQSWTNFPNFPHQVLSHIGGLIDENTILICGGRYISE